MKNTSPYYPLQWVVQHQDDMHRWWSPIAAFNHDRVAIDYAKDCAKGNAEMIKEFGFKYRVVARGARGKLVQIWST